VKRLLSVATALAAALALAGCASARNAVDSFHPEDHLAPGTSAAPNTAWPPPPSAIPHDVSRQPFTLPPGIEAGKPITLAQVIGVALANNPTTRTAWLQARAAEAALGSARSAYLPEIDVLASLTRGQTVSTTGQSVSETTTTTFAPSIALSYLLFDFGGREAQVDEARQTLIAADFLHNQAIQDVILRTEQAYYTYLDSKALLNAQDATIKERQTFLDSADARHRAGVATIADVLQARTALSQAQLTEETIQGNLRTIEGLLATSMGLPATTHFELGDLPLDIPAERVSEAVDAMIARATTERPDLAAQRVFADRARARILEVHAQGLPSVAFVASAGQNLYGGGLTGTPYSAGIALRFPLFTGWRNTYDVRQARVQSEVADEQVRSLEQQIDLEVWTSYFALQTATKRLGTSRDLLASAQESADVASNRYKAGVGSIIDLLTAEAALEIARAQEVQARADWFVAVAQLAHDTGTLGK
jgi:TolC family type I secretion outer membrane protein